MHLVARPGRPLLRSIFVALAMVMAFVVPSRAYTAYSPGSRGFDISFPQCGKTWPAGPSNQFANVGVTGGRAFSENPCLPLEYQHAVDMVQADRVSFYMNLNAAIGSSASNGLTGPNGNCKRGDKACLAYNYGWNAADAAIRYTAARPSSGIWWLDIETANSWNAQASLNRTTIQGAIDRLSSTQGVQVGIYSTPSMWNSITGGWTNGLPIWFAGTASTTCDAARAARFTNGPIWLVQHLSATDSGDEACVI